MVNSYFSLSARHMQVVFQGEHGAQNDTDRCCVCLHFTDGGREARDVGRPASHSQRAPSRARSPGGVASQALEVWEGEKGQRGRHPTSPSGSRGATRRG